MDFTGQVWKTGVENDMFWSEIGSGFGEPGGTPLPIIPRSTPPPDIEHCAFVNGNGNWYSNRVWRKLMSQEVDLPHTEHLLPV